MYSKQVLSAFLLLATSAFPYGSASSSLRASVASTRRLKLADDSECTLLVAEYLQIPGETAAPDSTIDCGMDDGMIFSIKGTPAQMKSLKKMWKDGEITSGGSKLGLGASSFVDSNGIFLPPGLDIAKNVRKGPKQERRRLKAPLTGDKPILVVKVTDSGGLARAESPAQIGDDVFGTLGDPVNLKSQLYDCSHGQMNVVPGTIPNASTNQAAPGVIEVTIPISITNNDRYVVHNAVTTAVNAKLGINLVDGWDQITEPYHQVMYVTEKCYTGCGWAAYAYINGWMSVYQAQYYKQVGVQVHELGHNFGLYHSGGLDGATYTDHTGMMGNPLYSDDVGKMCYNAAKNWAMPWYDDAKLVFNPVTEPSKTVNLVGIAEYNNRPNGESVVVKLETGLTDKFFIGFNRATGANAQNDEADNEVTIIKANSSGTSQSYLQAHLIQGESYAIGNFAGTGQSLVITAESIDISTQPGVAVVKFELQGSPTASPTNAPTATPTSAPSAAPTSAPTTASPTKSPTPNPTLPPTLAPTKAPTSAPSSSPTAAPTKSPTPNPTLPPTLAPTKTPTSAPSSSPTAAPTRSPTPNPTVPPTLAPTNPPTSSPTSSPTAVPTTSPTASPTATPTKAPTLPPSPAPTPRPTAFDQCSVHTNGGKCKKASGCSWNGVKCISDGAPTAPTSPVAAPSAEPPVGGPGPNECIASRLSCDLGTCCNGCQRNGRWANTCK